MTVWVSNLSTVNSCRISVALMALPFYDLRFVCLSRYSHSLSLFTYSRQLIPIFSTSPTSLSDFWMNKRANRRILHTFVVFFPSQDNRNRIKFYLFVSLMLSRSFPLLILTRDITKAFSFFASFSLLSVNDTSWEGRAAARVVDKGTSDACYRSEKKRRMKNLNWKNERWNWRMRKSLFSSSCNNRWWHWSWETVSIWREEKDFATAKLTSSLFRTRLFVCSCFA